MISCLSSSGGPPYFFFSGVSVAHLLFLFVLNILDMSQLFPFAVAFGCGSFLSTICSTCDADGCLCGATGWTSDVCMFTAVRMGGCNGRHQPFFFVWNDLLLALFECYLRFTGAFYVRTSSLELDFGLALADSFNRALCAPPHVDGVLGVIRVRGFGAVGIEVPIPRGPLAIAPGGPLAASYMFLLDISRV